MQKNYVSYIIPTWNQRNLLTECISSIIYNDTTKYTTHEIIVIDNASTDGSAKHIKVNFHDIILIQNTINLGYAKAINQGVRISKGNFIFLLNNDIKLLDNATEKLLSFFDLHPDAGAVAPLLYYPDGRLQLSCRRFPTPHSLLLEFLGIKGIGSFKRWKLTLEEHLRGGIVPQPMASALMIRRDCWEAVGPMDERFPIFFNDVDWCYRLYKHTNYKIYLYPEAKAIHNHGASTNLLGQRKKIEFYRGLWRFYRKHFINSFRLFTK